MRLPVFDHIGLVYEALPAVWAGEEVVGVDPLMCAEGRLSGKLLPTLRTRVRLFTCVPPLMTNQA